MAITAQRSEMLSDVDIDIFIVNTSRCFKYIKIPESQTELQSLKYAPSVLTRESPYGHKVNVHYM